MSRSLASLIALVSQSQARRVVYCRVRKTKYMMQFLNILRANNFIYGYSGESLSQEDMVFVYFRFYKYRPLLKGIRLFSKAGHRRFLKKDHFGYLAQKMDPGQIYITSSAVLSGMTSLRGLESLARISYKQKCGELLSTVW